MYHLLRKTLIVMTLFIPLMLTENISMPTKWTAGRLDNYKTVQYIGMISQPLTLRYNISQYNKLTARLLKGYNRNTLPTNDRSKPLNIQIAALLKVLLDLNEVDEKLSTVMEFWMSWRDDGMVWKNTEYSGISYITLNEGLTWIPYISILNPHHEKLEYERDADERKVTYTVDGFVICSYERLIMTTCDIDTTKFPFDKQVCKIQLFIAGFGGAIANTIHVDAEFQDSLEAYDNHGTWTIYNQSIESTGSSSFEISFYFKRKPTYMLVNVLVPIFFLSFLTPLVFLLPIDTGERSSFSITTLLAISVYMMVVGDNLPKNSHPMPLVIIMMFAWYISNSTIVVISIVNTNLSNLPIKTPIPHLIRKCVLKFWPPKSKFRIKLKRQTCNETTNRDLGNILTEKQCSKNSQNYGRGDKGNEGKRNNLERDVTSIRTSAVETNIDGNGNMANTDTEGFDSQDNATAFKKVVTWPDVSRAIDMFMLVFFYTAKMIFLVVMILFVNLHE